MPYGSNLHFLCVSDMTHDRYFPSAFSRKRSSHWSKVYCLSVLSAIDASMALPVCDSNAIGRYNWRLLLIPFLYRGTKIAVCWSLMTSFSFTHFDQIVLIILVAILLSILMYSMNTSSLPTALFLGAFDIASSSSFCHISSVLNSRCWGH